MTDQNAEVRQEYCSPSQKKIEHNPGSGASCQPRPGLLEQVGNAISGSAAALRAPGP